MALFGNEIEKYVRFHKPDSDRRFGESFMEAHGQKYIDMTGATSAQVRRALDIVLDSHRIFHVKQKKASYGEKISEDPTRIDDLVHFSYLDLPEELQEEPFSQHFITDDSAMLAVLTQLDKEALGRPRGFEHVVSGIMRGEIV